MLRARLAVVIAILALPLAVAPAASALPDPGSIAATEYPRFKYRYQVTDFRGFGRNQVSVSENGSQTFNGSWSVLFSYKGGSMTLRNPTRSRTTPNGAVLPTASPTLKLAARRFGPNFQLIEECTDARPGSLPKALIYYGPNAILRTPPRVPQNRLEIHWVLPSLPDVSCGGQTFPQGTQPSGRKAFTLTYTLTRFKSKFFQMPFEFHFSYPVPNGQGRIDWRGRLQLQRVSG
jgi:hypothetical protein